MRSMRINKEIDLDAIITAKASIFTALKSLPFYEIRLNNPGISINTNLNIPMINNTTSIMTSPLLKSLPSLTTAAPAPPPPVLAPPSAISDNLKVSTPQLLWRSQGLRQPQLLNFSCTLNLNLSTSLTLSKSPPIFQSPTILQLLALLTHTSTNSPTLFFFFNIFFNLNLGNYSFEFSRKSSPAKTSISGSASSFFSSSHPPPLQTKCPFILFLKICLNIDFDNRL